MRLLLDTHIAVWATQTVDRLSDRAKGLLLDPDNEVWFSHVSIWEIAVKQSTGRRTSVDLPDTPTHAVEVFHNAGFAGLPITLDHITGVAALPPLHGDPFDRLIVAQSLAEPMRLLTHDRQVAAYSDSVILA